MKTNETTNLTGQSISKNDNLIHFTGTTDELNSHLGLVKAMLSDEHTRRFIEGIQKNLMLIMAHASDPNNKKYFLNDNEIAVLEKEIKKLSDKRLTQFVIPGRNVTEAQIHIARTVTRRTERLFVAANADRTLLPVAGEYLNKLSGYLFALSLQEA